MIVERNLLTTVTMPDKSNLLIKLLDMTLIHGAVLFFDSSLLRNLFGQIDFQPFVSSTIKRECRIKWCWRSQTKFTWTANETLCWCMNNVFWIAIHRVIMSWKKKMINKVIVTMVCGINERFLPLQKRFLPLLKTTMYWSALIYIMPCTRVKWLW